MKTEPPTDAPGGLRDAYCSPAFSGTLETDALASTMFPDGSRWVQAEDCRKFERQRNKLADYIHGIAEDAEACGDEILSKQMRQFVAGAIANGK